MATAPSQLKLNNGPYAFLHMAYWSLKESDTTSLAGEIYSCSQHQFIYVSELIASVRDSVHLRNCFLFFLAQPIILRALNTLS